MRCDRPLATAFFLPLFSTLLIVRFVLIISPLFFSRFIILTFVKDVINIENMAPERDLSPALDHPSNLPNFTNFLSGFKVNLSFNTLPFCVEDDKCSFSIESKQKFYEKEKSTYFTHLILFLFIFI